MRQKPQGKGEESKVQVNNFHGRQSKEMMPQENHQKDTNQEWIPVVNRKPRAGNGNILPSNAIVSQQVGEFGNSKAAGSPVVVEVGEIMDDHGAELEEVQQGLNMDPASAVKGQRQLQKSNSTNFLIELEEKEDMGSREFLVRSSSMSDIPKQCKESRLEYLREEFNHLHLVSKQLKRTREETQNRLKIMEIRKSQNRDYQTDIQQYQDAQSQEDCSRVPETQMPQTQNASPGETNQKKKKGIQIGKKPVTRATKKQNTPKKS